MYLLAKIAIAENTYLPQLTFFWFQVHLCGLRGANIGRHRHLSEPHAESDLSEQKPYALCGGTGQWRF